jgi:hypothetical protein
LFRYKRENILLLGIADHEPKDCNKFFEPLVSELERLGEHGMVFDGINRKVKLKFISADLPAKKKVI